LPDEQAEPDDTAIPARIEADDGSFSPQGRETVNKVVIRQPLDGIREYDGTISLPQPPFEDRSRKSLSRRLSAVRPATAAVAAAAETRAMPATFSVSGNGRLNSWPPPRKQAAPARSIPPTESAHRGPFGPPILCAEKRQKVSAPIRSPSRRNFGRTPEWHRHAKGPPASCTDLGRRRCDRLNGAQFRCSPSNDRHQRGAGWSRSNRRQVIPGRTTPAGVTRIISICSRKKTSARQHGSMFDRRTPPAARRPSPEPRLTPRRQAASALASVPA